MKKVQVILHVNRKKNSSSVWVKVAQSFRRTYSSRYWRSGKTMADTPENSGSGSLWLFENHLLTTLFGSCSPSFLGRAIYSQGYRECTECVRGGGVHMPPCEGRDLRTACSGDSCFPPCLKQGSCLPTHYGGFCLCLPIVVQVQGM